MAWYIDTPVRRFKAHWLADNVGAIPTNPYRRPPADRVMVCVIEHDVYDAAAIVISSADLVRMQHADEHPRTWWTVEREELLGLIPDEVERRDVRQHIADFGDLYV